MLACDSVALQQLKVPIVSCQTFALAEKMCKDLEKKGFVSLKT